MVRPMLFLLFTLLFIFSGCEKFTGFKYSADDPTLYTRIEGVVTNLFTGEPVADAKVRFAFQTTLTDDAGHYLMFFPLGTDEDRNKPVQITIDAENFGQYRTSKILVPISNNFDFRIEYVAPIIDKMALVPVATNLLVFEAVIIDYQGVADITYTRGRFSYAKMFEPSLRWEESPLTLVGQEESWTGHFQCLVEATIDAEWELSELYEITVRDQAGHSDEALGKYHANRPDTLLFPPILP